VSPWRRRRAEDPFAGSLDPIYPPPPPEQPEPRAHPVEEEPPPRRPARDPDAPSTLRRAGSALGDARRRVIPLPDEVVEEFLGDGEQVIHSDHPSFRSFAVENTLLFIGFIVVGVLFLGITFNGSLVASGLLLIGLAIVFLILVLKRLGDRYTSYVVTDTRIMQIQGVVSRRAHSIPWVRVTDLTVDQSLMGRLFGYATLHIESANEDSGLRDLDGVSDPMRFNKVVVDMVVAKQGTTQPAWVAAGEPVPPGVNRGLRRVRMSRRRRGDEVDDAYPEVAEPAPEPPPERVRMPGTRTVRRPPGTAATQVAPPAGDRPYDVDAEVDNLDAETLAAQLEQAGAPGSDLHWADDDDKR
jgi:membrane protein YdbS with pleckstrin-like domain